MATVTGYTAGRMLAIENNSVVSGTISGDNLILTRQGGGTINAGNVRGATGSPGATVSQLTLAMPIGIIADYIGSTAPTNWLGIAGQTIVNGQTTYPDLWAILPAGMKSGSSIVFPDSRGRVAVNLNPSDTDFDTIGEVGGAKTHIITQAELPAVAVSIDPPSTTISINPPSTTVSISDPGHHHTVAGGARQFAVTAGTTGGQTLSGATDLLFSAPTSSPTTDNATTGITASVDIAAFNATVDIAAFNTANLGSGSPTSLVQPYIVFMKIIRAL